MTLSVYKVKLKKTVCTYFHTCFSISSVIALHLCMVFTVGSLLAQNDPTPEEIADEWATFGGGLDGMVVYNTGEEMWILHLETGQAEKLMNYAQADFSFSNNWGVSSGYRISPDGTRITAQNGSGVIVCNIDGTSAKIIWTGRPPGDQIALCWDGNDRVVYSSCIDNNNNWKIASTEINDDNSAGATTLLWDRAVDKLPHDYEDSGEGFVSVNKSGDYLSFDVFRHDCSNLPIIVNLSTGEVRDPIECEDGCQVRMWMDSSGTISLHEDIHMAPATLYKWGSGVLRQTVPMPPSSVGGCGNGGYSWAYNSDYMIQTGDNDLRNSPGCISKARIRKTSDFSQIMYLGSTFYWPDLWVGDLGTPVRRGNRSLPGTGLSSAVSIRTIGNELTITHVQGGVIIHAQLFNLKGVSVARGERVSGSTQRFAVSQLPVGTYVLSWKQSHGTYCRHITIER